VKTTSQ